MRYFLVLLATLLWASGPVRAEGDASLVQCQRIGQAQLRTASEQTLLFLRCRARQVAYEAPRLKGVSQRYKDDLVFACLDQADAVEHQLRVRHGYSREALARQRCTPPGGAAG